MLDKRVVVKLSGRHRETVHLLREVSILVIHRHICVCKCFVTVVLNLEGTGKETVRRIIDFLSGIAYAIEGQIKRVANSTYVITPKNVDVSSGVENQVDDSQKELF